MDSVNTKIKRKIRRTRRNLNEIRRRANTKTRDNNKTKCITRAPIILTTNRLTLLNKAVKSETVTRAHIPKRKTKSSTTDNESGKDVELTYLQNQSENIEFLNSSNFIKEDKNNLCTMIPRIASGTFLECNWDIQYTNELVSPLQTDNSNRPFNDLLQSCLSSDSSAALQTVDDGHIYEQFMKSISNHISKAAPALLNTDIINKRMNTLRNICLDDLTHPNDNTLQCYYSSSSSDKTIVQNQDCTSPDQTSPAVCSLSSHSSSHAPVYPSCAVIYDSPEYHFYPHKLNQ